MKNKFLDIFVYFILSFFVMFNSYSNELFNFNISEIEITQNGNLIRGFNGGEAFTNDGVTIKAKDFEYNKLLTLLIAKNGVELKDIKKNLKINANEILYIKNQEKIIANNNVKIIDNDRNIEISAKKISYLKNKNEIIAEGDIILKDINKNILIKSDKIFLNQNNEIIIADGNVYFNDQKNNIQLLTKKITYEKNIYKIFTEGITSAEIKSKYKFKSKDITFLKDEMRLFSSEKTHILDKDSFSYNLDNFDYQISKEFLKGTNITIIENSNLGPGESNKYYFESGFFDLKNKDFKTTDTKISLKKNIFDRTENDPRLYGVSSDHKNGITTIKKAVFTSCKKTDKCPPWSLEASEIKHDKNKKQLIYDNSILKFYDIPVFYFPKFFHPDPTVNRQSGFLVPKLNNSNILGSSVSLPYFKVISENKDYTLNPTYFSKDIFFLQQEYRQENKNSSFVADVGFVNNYTSSSTNKNKKIYHFFSNFKKNLELDNFNLSNLSIFVERVSKDTYLKIFSDNFTNSIIKPSTPDKLKSGFNISLENQDYSISTGADIYEDLTKLQSDRYQFVAPFFDFYHNPISFGFGSINISSSGNNIVDNTNNQKTRIINNINFNFNENIYENIGLKNNFNVFFKNLNSSGKNVDTYKSSPQIELQSLVEIKSELPMIKSTNYNNHTLVPQLSLRLNPGDMKNHSSDKRKINTDNIFDINRIGVSDSFESGNSLTFGIDYKKENKEDNQKYLKLELATVFRDSEEKNIPSETTLNQKNSNIFGSVDYKISDSLIIDYNFAIDNNLNNLAYNSIGLDLSINNFVTKFNFIEEETSLGNTNVFENTTEYRFDDNNSISFNTRRNRELNLTEYYNLIYEYKNDCLTAGIRFNKSYYEDRDLKPSENLMFTISFYPITSIEQSFK